MQRIKKFLISYTVFIVLGVFSQIELCAARPEDEQTQNNVSEVRLSILFKK